MENVTKRRRIFLSFSKLGCRPQEINSRKIRLHLTFSADGNKRDSVRKKAKVTFSLPSLSTIFSATSVAMLEQCCSRSKQRRNNVVMLCCAKNRRCESCLPVIDEQKPYPVWFLRRRKANQYSVNTYRKIRKISPSMYKPLQI